MVKKAASLTTGEVKETYEALSGTASGIVRQLSLAGIALIWLFKTGASSAPVLEPQLLRAALFIFVALSLDLLQYLIGTFTWHRYFLYKENKRTPPNETFEAPNWINWPTWTLFWFKSASMITAYSFILHFLYEKFIG
jgi:hypothetical protein